VVFEVVQLVKQVATNSIAAQGVGVFIEFFVIQQILDSQTFLSAFQNG